MKKGLYHIGLYGLLTILLANLLAWSCLWSLRQAAFYKPGFLVNQVTETHFDYIILGSSTGLTTLNTVRIDSLIHTNGLNLSMDDTGLPSQYLMLQHFLAENKTAGVVVLVINPWEGATTTVALSDNDYRFLPFINRPYVQQHFSAISEKGLPVLAWSRYAPMLGVSYYNAELTAPSLLALWQPERRNRFDARGNYVYPNDGFVFDKKPTTTHLHMEHPYLQKITEVCSKNGIALLLYQPPIYATEVKDSLTPNFINHSTLFKDKTYFYDAMHVNAKGRKEASSQFAEVFKRKIKSFGSTVLFKDI
ncbi:MAG: hypothetical protein CVU03_09215 [Bacteroidetes bacterium HGW-Bacteroidetes-2]|jgi:hypothetical protein|nr:MAG: hypothetical protein CVU03_09215 [Bacteroidetes bacterium HGW-Bacteroidetes-2]